MENREKVEETINAYSIRHILAQTGIEAMINVGDSLTVFMASVDAEVQLLADDPDFLAGFIYNFVITSMLNVIFGDISPEKENRR